MQPRSTTPSGNGGSARPAPVQYRGILVAIEGKSAKDLIELAQAGACIELDARRYSAPDLVAIARSLRGECFLTIVNCEGKSTNDLVSVVSAAPGRVTVA